MKCDIATAIILALVCFALGLFVDISTDVKGYMRCYKAGQVDAINGIINWELQKQKDGSVQWVYIEKENGEVK